MLPSTIGSRYIASRSRSARVIFELVASAPEAKAGCYRHTMRYVSHEGVLPEYAPELGSTFTVEDAWFRERTDIKPARAL
jgi:hypothetical protein